MMRYYASVKNGSKESPAFGWHRVSQKTFLSNLLIKCEYLGRNAVQIYVIVYKCREKN